MVGNWQQKGGYISRERSCCAALLFLHCLDAVRVFLETRVPLVFAIPFLPSLLIVATVAQLASSWFRGRPPLEHVSKCMLNYLGSCLTQDGPTLALRLPHLLVALDVHTRRLRKPNRKTLLRR